MFGFGFVPSLSSLSLCSFSFSVSVSFLRIPFPPTSHFPTHYIHRHTHTLRLPPTSFHFGFVSFQSRPLPSPSLSLFPPLALLVLLNPPLSLPFASLRSHPNPSSFVRSYVTTSFLSIILNPTIFHSFFVLFVLASEKEEERASTQGH